jgi:hypothetical protein
MNNIKEIINEWPLHHLLGGNDYTGGLEQNAYELEQFCYFVKNNEIKTYTEVGIAAGLLLKFMRDVMNLEVYGITLEKRDTHKDLPVVYGYSDDKNILENAKFCDMYFIDANHSYEWVNKDYHNYKDKCKFMAFHDILGMRHCEGVAQLWAEIKDKYPSWEFINSDKNIASGIGVIKLI